MRNSVTRDRLQRLSWMKTYTMVKQELQTAWYSDASVSSLFVSVGQDSWTRDNLPNTNLLANCGWRLSRPWKAVHSQGSVLSCMSFSSHAEILGSRRWIGFEYCEMIRFIFLSSCWRGDSEACGVYINIAHDPYMLARDDELTAIWWAPHLQHFSISFRSWGLKTGAPQRASPSFLP